MRAPFVPSNLVKLLGGYARMGHISSTCSSMLDAAAGFVVRRMAAGHLNAVTKLSDLSQLLQAYATLGHQTLVMPELLTSASNQVSLLEMCCMPRHLFRVGKSDMLCVNTCPCHGLLWCCYSESKTVSEFASCQTLHNGAYMHRQIKLTCNAGRMQDRCITL